MSQFWPDSFVSWSGLVATVIGGLWALISFHRNNQTRAAEILINIEKDYASHIKCLLAVENMTSYREQFEEALKIALNSSPDTDQYSDEQSEAIDRLESALRHFFVCANIRQLGVDPHAIDRLCAYYLRVLVTDRNAKGKFKRPELRDYIRRYWPTIYFWAPLAPEPWPKRLLIFTSQIPDRFDSWWSGSWSKAMGQPQSRRQARVSRELEG